MQPFIAPSHSLPLNWTVDFLFPVLLKIVQNIEDVVIDPEDVRMLRTLRKDRMLFFTNHPTTAEPPIAHYIGKLMGVRFKYGFAPGVRLERRNGWQGNLKPGRLFGDRWNQ